jgi:deoxyribonuclease (pyrimidine dimer)
MVRINLINPKSLADQHLIAEYNEILMLLGHVDKFPEIKDQPLEYCLGKGHINFFKNKIKYLKDRHEIIKNEMNKRGYKTSKTIKLNKYPNTHFKNWIPKPKDKEIIKKRLIFKINLKSNYYRYYGEKKNKKFLIDLISKG